jgi:hypothetical protein
LWPTSDSKVVRFTYRASAGHFADGALAEIFLDVPGKLGTPLQSNANTAAVLTSLPLQHGVAPEVSRASRCTKSFYLKGDRRRFPTQF